MKVIKFTPTPSTTLLHPRLDVSTRLINCILRNKKKLGIYAPDEEITFKQLYQIPEANLMALHSYGVFCKKELINLFILTGVIETKAKRKKSISKKDPNKVFERRKIHTIWAAIINRTVTNKKHLYYMKGIRVSEEFKNSFDIFFAYVSSLPKYNITTIGIGTDKLSLDRINNNGDYERGNLRWATKREQFENSYTFKNQLWFPTSVTYATQHSKTPLKRREAILILKRM